jgi:mono/diheme cytochrome c family protein
MGTASLLLAFALGATSASAQAAKESKGQKIFMKSHCISCHSVKAVGIEKKTVEGDEAAAEVAKSAHKPPDLSDIGLQHDQAWFAKWLTKKENVDGRMHKIKFRGTDAELKTLTTWIASLKMDESGKPKAAEPKPAEK